MVRAPAKSEKCGLNRSVTLALALQSQELQCAFCLDLSVRSYQCPIFTGGLETPTKTEPHNRAIWILKRGCEKPLPWFPYTRRDRSLCELLVHMGLYPQRRAGDGTPELREDSVGWSYSMKWAS